MGGSTFRTIVSLRIRMVFMFVCLFVCLFACLFVCLFVRLLKVDFISFNSFQFDNNLPCLSLKMIIVKDKKIRKDTL